MKTRSVLMFAAAIYAGVAPGALGGQRTSLRGSDDRLLGYIEETNYGEVLLSPTNDRLGEYYRRDNSTRDASDRLVGYGNLLALLLDEACRH